MQRRPFLGLIAATGAIPVAGCTGGGDDGGDTQPTDAADPTPTDGAPDPTPTEDGGSTDDHFLGEWMVWSDAYVMEMDYEDQDTGDAGHMVLRIGGDRSHWYVDSDQQGVSEMYAIDGDMYLVSDGECVLMPGNDDPTDDFGYNVDPETYGEDARNYPDLQPAGTDTIDGEPMYVYEVTAADDAESATYYVSQTTGHLRRVVGEWGTVDLHSWGSVGPIEPPDMECESFDMGRVSAWERCRTGRDAPSSGARIGRARRSVPPVPARQTSRTTSRARSSATGARRRGFPNRRPGSRKSPPPRCDTGRTAGILGGGSTPIGGPSTPSASR
ncbi:MAG: hypothetical protein ACOC0X_04055 [Halobacteriota archaeon]